MLTVKWVRQWLIALTVVLGACGPTRTPGTDPTGDTTDCTTSLDCVPGEQCSADGVCAKPPQTDSIRPSIYTRAPECWSSCAIDVPLSFTFSEPIVVPPGAMTVSFAPTSAAVPYEVSLSEDQRTVTVSFSGLSAPTDVTIDLSSVTDLSGNPSMTTSLEYGFPLWYTTGAPAVPTESARLQDFSVASTASGSAVMVWEESHGYPPYSLYVSRHGPEGWVNVGTLDLDPLHDRASPRIDARGDVVAVAWIENKLVRVAKVTDAGIEHLAGAANSSGAIFNPPAIAVDASGRPVVAWLDGGVHLARWSGSAWESLPDGASEVGVVNANNPSIAIHPEGHICVAHRGGDPVAIRIRCLVDGAWEVLAPDLPVGISILDDEGLLITADGTALVTWRTGDDQYVAEFSGGEWRQMSLPIDFPLSGDAELAVDPVLGIVSSYCNGDAVGVLVRGDGSWTEKVLFELSPSSSDRISECELGVGEAGTWMGVAILSSERTVHVLRANR